MNIARIFGYEILASGGFPTLEVRAELDSGEVGVASVPYGASAGSHEATVLLDGDQRRYQGNGMLKAVANVETLARELVGKPADDQRAIDELLMKLDGTENKKTYGGNTLLAVSLACARAAARAHQQPLYRYIATSFSTTATTDFSHLPRPMMVVIEGGKHADNSTDLQEYSFSSLTTDRPVHEGIRECLEAYHQLKEVLKENNLSTNVGNEGAFAPDGITSNEAPFAFMLEAIKRAGYEPGREIGFSIDAAASEFLANGRYKLAVEKRSLSASELIEYYRSWFAKYPIVTVEDMLGEDDWENWPKLLEVCQQFKIEQIGDDLTATNPRRLQQAIDTHSITSILIKLNQIGTLTETVDVCLQAKAHGLSTVTSHRGGGESNDTAMVDVAVAVGSRFIKVGPTRGERVSKYNRLMEIERELG